MSDSIFGENANALLTFKVATGLHQRDPNTGNQIEIVGTIEIKAMLNLPRRASSTIELPGPDRTETFMKGRAVDPSYLPASIQSGARAQCALVDLFTGAEQIGEFVVSSVHQSAFAAVTEILGSSIEGYFKIDDAGEVLYEA